MPQIEVDFGQYLPSLGVFYGYFDVLKAHHFIEDVKVVQKEGHNTLRIYRSAEKDGLQL